MTWTQFHDMHSGGGQKLEWAQIFIEAPEAEARRIFESMFDRDPDNVTCDCCGADYSVSEDVSLAQATGYERRCRHLKTPRGPDGRYSQPTDPAYREHFWLERDEEPPTGFEVDSDKVYGEYATLDEYCARPDVKIVRASEFK